MPELPSIPPARDLAAPSPISVIPILAFRVRQETQCFIFVLASTAAAAL